MASIKSVIKNLYRKYWQSRITYQATKDFLQTFLVFSQHDLNALEKKFTQLFEKKTFSIGGPQAILNDDALALYLVVRKFKPQIMVETGTYQGYSSHVIIDALKANGSGSFITCDIMDYRVFQDDFDGNRFKFLLGPSTSNFSTIPFEKVDMFFHDSNHLYDNVLFEIGVAVSKNVKVILCHDFGKDNIHNTIKAVDGKGCRDAFIKAIGDKYTWVEIPTMNGIGLAVLKTASLK